MRYEVGVGIKHGFIVSEEGPILCREFTDQSIFNHGNECRLLRGEKVVADEG